MRRLLLEHKSPQYGEPFARWHDEIRAMRSALEVWDASPRQLAKWIRIESSGVVLDRGEDAGESSIITGTNYRSALWRFVEDSKVAQKHRLRRAALFYIQAAINERLRKHVAPRLLYNPDDDQVEQHLWSKNLLGAIWLQFARAVEIDKPDYGRCEACQKPFEVSPEGMRPETKYCGVKCRVRADRKRAAETLRLGQAGKDVESIAKEVGSAEDTVRRRLSKAKIKPVEKPTRRRRKQQKKSTKKSSRRRRKKEGK